MSMPLVAIVGRPNVGKSTLFNRFIKKRLAIVDDQPGVTRDRLYGVCTWEDRTFTVIDTGGFELDTKQELMKQMRDQTEIAIQEADVVIYLMDAKDGLLDIDREIVNLLYKVHKNEPNKNKINRKIIFVVNKVESPRIPVQDFYALGSSFLTISAEHGLGISDLMDEIVKYLPPASVSSQKEEEDAIRVAVIGRPNVGKSSLINSFLRENRMVVNDIPGTTRDAVNSYLRYNYRQYTLIDTAGIRRKGKTNLALEKYSIICALKHLESCDVALMLIDAVDGVTNQDTTIAGYAYEAGKPCILIVNKWDLVRKDSDTMARYQEKIREDLKYLSFAPMVFVSAYTGLRVFSIFPHIEKLYDQYTKKISTPALNRVVRQFLKESPPPSYQGKRIKILYQTQIGVKPPTFLFFVNNPEGIHFSYERYLLNQLRLYLDMPNIPLRIFFRKNKS